MDDGHDGVNNLPLLGHQALTPHAHWQLDEGATQQTSNSLGDPFSNGFAVSGPQGQPVLGNMPADLISADASMPSLPGFGQPVVSNLPMDQLVPADVAMPSFGQLVLGPVPGEPMPDLGQPLPHDVTIPAMPSLSQPFLAAVMPDQFQLLSQDVGQPMPFGAMFAMPNLSQPVLGSVMPDVGQPDVAMPALGQLVQGPVPAEPLLDTGQPLPQDVAMPAMPSLSQPFPAAVMPDKFQLLPHDVGQPLPFGAMFAMPNLSQPVLGSVMPEVGQPDVAMPALGQLVQGPVPAEPLLDIGQPLPQDVAMPAMPSLSQPFPAAVMPDKFQLLPHDVGQPLPFGAMHPMPTHPVGSFPVGPMPDVGQPLPQEVAIPAMPSLSQSMLGGVMPDTGQPLSQDVAMPPMSSLSQPLPEAVMPDLDQPLSHDVGQPLSFEMIAMPSFSQPLPGPSTVEFVADVAMQPRPSSCQSASSSSFMNPLPTLLHEPGPSELSFGEVPPANSIGQDFEVYRFLQDAQVMCIQPSESQPAHVQPQEQALVAGQALQSAECQKPKAEEVFRHIVRPSGDDLLPFRTAVIKPKEGMILAANVVRLDSVGDYAIEWDWARSAHAVGLKEKRITNICCYTKSFT